MSRGSEFSQLQMTIYRLQLIQLKVEAKHGGNCDCSLNVLGTFHMNLIKQSNFPILLSLLTSVS